MNILNRVVGGNLTRNQDFWSKTRFEVMKIEIQILIISIRSKLVSSLANSKEFLRFIASPDTQKKVLYSKNAIQ